MEDKRKVEENQEEIMFEKSSLAEEDTPVTRLRDFLLVLLEGFFHFFEKGVISIFAIIIAIISILYLFFSILGF